MFVKVQNSETSKGLTSEFTTDDDEDPFIVHLVEEAYLLVFNRSKFSSFYENYLYARKYTIQKTSRDSLDPTQKGVYIPGNETAY